MTLPGPYKYEPLRGPDDIRLLDIHPGAAEDPIVISLRAASLSENPDFEALSYVWGDPTATREVLCRGKNDNGATLGVTANLFDALAQLRRPDRPRALWADAVCIHQADLDEKARQIQIMHRIYRACRRCAVWLGRADEHSAAALDIVEAMAGIVCERLGLPDAEQLETQLEEHGRDPLQALRIGFDQGLPPQDSPKWISLFWFLCRPWFSRVWVIQEAYFSPEIFFHCWDRTARYAALYHTADWVLNHGNQVGYATGFAAPEVHSTRRFNVLYVRGDRHARQTQRLADLLNNHKKFDATDPRDKVYAMMHLPPFRREYPGLVPDYRPANTTADVYADVALRLLSSRDPFRVLTMVDANPDEDEKDHRLPSWVPRWHRADKRSGVSSMWYQFMSAAVTPDATAAKHITKVPGPGRVLRVRGLEFDVVHDVCGLESWGPRIPSTPRIPLFTPAEPWTPYDLSSPPYASKPDVVAAYSMALTASCREYQGFYAIRCAPENHAHHAADFVAWLTWIRTLREAPPDTPHQNFYPPGLYSPDQPTLIDTAEAELTDMSLRYSLMTWNYNMGRSLVRTSRGYLGTAPNDVKKGDVVCIFMGAAVPFILRPRDAVDGGYTLIGDGYIHGIMDGELVSDWDEAKQNLRDFDIH